MKILKRSIISTVRSGVYQYAIIESLHHGLATVRLGGKGTGTRLTNLTLVGAAEVGELAIVDYSTDRPYVKSAQHYEIEVDEIEEAPQLPESSPDPCDF